MRFILQLLCNVTEEIIEGVGNFASVGYCSVVNNYFRNNCFGLALPIQKLIYHLPLLTAVVLVSFEKLFIKFGLRKFDVFLGELFHVLICFFVR